ncbi:EamA/RhaT family transporter [Streptomyces sp. Je 1-369]|uniref:EamA/RhaT family transporter n=1 Tax=Streptomyces sp. Je 1-369 TaxID=2966192 RepID=UPI0022865D85|nr:EamA/RhaT family transporter [Streptomyces sp. Je 1-369]WAL97080.1 EamA/RhaT family transporter [Streptomyces sp. Je 1-369]
MTEDPAPQTPPPGSTATTSGTAPGPQPEPLRFFGTTWVAHDGGYGARRVGVAIGSLVAAAIGCFVLRFAYEGLAIAAVGTFVNLLVVVMFAICSALAFRRTWEGFSRRHDAASQSSTRGLMTIGFVGTLLAYFFRSFSEAPGEKLHREEYDEARDQYEKRTARRTGNPRNRRKR